MRLCGALAYFDILTAWENRSTSISSILNRSDEPRGWTLKLFLSPPLIDMVDQRPPQTAKESKGFSNRLKKMLGRGSQSTPPADLAPTTVSTVTTDPVEAAKLRAKYTHFRILVIGRANAGKTTLLKRVCNTKEDPVYSKVRYPLRLIPHSRHPFTDRLTRPRRCQLLAHFSNQVVDFDAVARNP